jgi:hypothetical protein
MDLDREKKYLGDIGVKLRMIAKMWRNLRKHSGKIWNEERWLNTK